MPGILPMKVIKVGGAGVQSRIAQACDRCRSKKIRCDGTTPCCSQCANVGFECKTSDKLSRRAFPRGYTESLEERVRSLESEVKELKDLLDAKDEKIDILSKIYSSCAPSLERTSSTPSSFTDVGSRTNSIDAHALDEDTTSLQQSPGSNGDMGLDSHFIGASSGRSFVDAFKRRLKDTGKQFPNFKTQSFFDLEVHEPPSPENPISPTDRKIPSRMASDQMINIFFQEWASLFPILHRPMALKLYSEFVADPDNYRDQHALAQLYLIFGIASVSTKSNKHDAEAFEPQWQAALESVSKEITVPTLQCLLLALLYTIAKRDFGGLLKYKAAAVRIARRLGLHQRQRRSSVGPLITETRKRVFWTLYTVDCFSAALLGQPRSFSDEDITCEYPQDVDDENVTEEGFQPTLSGETTRLSSALALFRGARILSGVLDQIYPAAVSHHLPVHTIAALSEELDTWLTGLPLHLRLQFAHDKPSTKVVGSRSPFLSLAYHYIRTLIHRPLAGSDAGSRASASIVALAQSSKHVTQIIQLLEERGMSFSFCLNQDHILTLAGVGLLFQTLNLDRKGKLIEDSQRLICSVVSILERNSAPGAVEFKKVACGMISIDQVSKTLRPVVQETTIRRDSPPTMPTPKTTTKSPRKFQALISQNSSSVTPTMKGNVYGRRLTASTPSMPTLPTFPHINSHISVRSTNPKSLGDNGQTKQENITTPHGLSEPLHLPNLDYLDFGNEPALSSNEISPVFTANTTNGANTGSSCMDAYEQGRVDAMLASPDVFGYIAKSPSKSFDWCTDTWSMPTDVNEQPQRTQSTMNISEEVLTSGEELSSCSASEQLKVGNGPKDDGFIALDGLGAGFGW